MATNQLSDQDRTAIKKAVDHLFGRAITHFPCPLQTMDERRDLYWCSRTDQQLQALSELHTDRIAVFRNHYEVELSIGHEAYAMFLKRADSSDNDDYFWGAPMMGGVIPLERIRQRVPKAEDLLSWLGTTKKLGAECALAFPTFMELLRMCSTAGQVRRVLPELVDFMPSTVKLILGKQTRASNVPFEWSAFDRSRVEQLTNTMAKCMLLAHNTDDPHSWAKRGDYTWPVITQAGALEQED